MIPDFTLSLSFQGITLLQRHRDGWAVLDEVTLDVPDLSGALASMRKRADKAGARDGQVMLLIPNEQVRYLDIAAPTGDDAARDAAVAGALDGATPYAVADLVIDHAPQGDRLAIAAVARETLDEAQSFARGHHFIPVGFAASPPQGRFGAPVFFGAVSGWQGAAPSRETLPYHTRVSLDAAGTGDPVAKNVDRTATTGPGTSDAATATEIQDATPPAPTEQAEISEDIAPTDVPPSETSEEPATAAPADATQAAAPAPPAPTADAAQAVPAAAKAAPNGSKTDPGTAPDPALEASFDRPAPLPEDADNTEPKGPDAATALPTEAEISAPIPPTPPTPAAKPASPAFSSIRATRAAPEQSGPKLGSARHPGPQPSENAAGHMSPTLAKSGAKITPPHPAAPDLTQVGIADGQVPDDTAGRPVGKAAKSGRAAGFFSRRKARRAAPLPSTPRAPKAPAPVKSGGRTRRPKPIPAPAAQSPGAEVADEADRMTVFGARAGQAAVGGKPRYLGLMLTAALLLFLAGVAAWASVFLDDGLARFFRPSDPAPAIANAPALPADALPSDDLASDTFAGSTSGSGFDTVPDDGVNVELAALDAGPDTDAVNQPLGTPRAAGNEIGEDEARANYAATGIWQRAPDAPALPDEGNVDGLYTASIDPDVGQSDAVALPPLSELVQDPLLEPLPDPLPADTVFDLDERGFVRPTLEGSLTPEGVPVYAGKPPVAPPLRPADAALLVEDPAGLAEKIRLEQLRPRARPGDLQEQRERAELAGRSKLELAGLRPVMRPRTAQEVAEAAETPPTAQAVDAAPLPRTRPRDFERVVKAARAAAPAQETRVASAAAVAPATVQPRIPSSASVSKEATVRNVLNLRKINLIGVYGKPASRRALVRLSNGRYQKVKVGDRIDGGRVSAIGETELRYTKRGRNIVLKMPRS